MGPPLPSADIWSLLAARDGTLWIGTLDGLFSWHEGKLIEYPELAGKAVVALLEDHDGNGVGGRRRRAVCDSAAKRFSAVRSKVGPATELYYSWRSRQCRLFLV